VSNDGYTSSLRFSTQNRAYLQCVEQVDEPSTSYSQLHIIVRPHTVQPLAHKKYNSPYLHDFAFDSARIFLEPMFSRHTIVPGSNASNRSVMVRPSHHKQQYPCKDCVHHRQAQTNAAWGPAPGPSTVIGPVSESLLDDFHTLCFFLCASSSASS